jgi:hypothetical protein
MADLLAVALACDLVRVFSFQLSGALDQTIYWQFGLTQEYHASTHNGIVYGRVQPPLTEMYMASYAYLLEKLKASAEGAGNILDNCLILGTSEFLDAKRHTDLNHPFVIAGRAGGRWKSGQHLAAPGENMTKVLVASVRAVGVNVNGIGDANSSFYASDALAGLL